MAGKQIGLQFTVDATQGIKSCDDLSKGMTGISRSAKALTNDGADVAKILQSIGERGGAAFQELIQQGQAEGRTLQQIKADVLALANEQKKAAVAQKAAIIEEAAAMAILQKQQADQAQGMANAAGQIHSFLGPIDSTLKSAGASSLAFGRSMTAAFNGNVEAAQNAKEAIERVRLATGASDEEMLHSVQAVQKFGEYSEENLMRAAVAAKRTGASVDEVAQALGRMDKFADAKGANKMKTLLGIDPEAVARENGLLDASGKIMRSTAEERKRFVEAMNRAVDAANAGKGMDNLTSGATKSRIELELLEKEMGEASVTAANKWVAGAQPVIHALREMPDAAKGAAGQLISVGTSLSGIGAGALQTAANLRMAGTTFSGAFSAATAAIGPVGLLLMGVAAAVGWVTTAQEASNQKLEENLKRWQKLNDELRKHHDLQVKIAQGGTGSVSEVGDLENKELERKKALVSELKDLEERRATSQAHRVAMYADQRDNDELDAEIERVRQLIALQNRQLQQTAQAKQRATADLPMRNTEAEAAKRAMESWANFQRRKEEGVYETKRQEKAALDEVNAAFEASRQVRKQHGVTEEPDAKVLEVERRLQTERARIGREATREGTAAELKLALDAMEIEDIRFKLSHDQKIARYRVIQQIAGLSGDQRIEIEKKIAHEEAAASDEVVKKAAEAARKAEEAERKSLEAAQKKADAEADLASKLQALEGQTTASKLREIEKQADAYRKAGANAVQIAKFVAESRAAVEREAADKARDTAEKDAAKREQAAQKLSSAQSQVAKDREDQLKAEMADGKDNSAELQASIETRYRAEEDAIKHRLAAEEQANGRSSDLEQAAALETLHLENQKAKELREIIKLRDELAKKAQTEAGLAFKGGGQSVADAFKADKNFGYSNTLSVATTVGGTGAAGPATGAAAAAAGPSTPAPQQGLVSAEQAAAAPKDRFNTSGRDRFSAPVDANRAAKEAEVVKGDGGGGFPSTLQVANLTIIAQSVNLTGGGGAPSSAPSSGPASPFNPSRRTAIMEQAAWSR